MPSSKYISATYTSAAENITINGLEPSSAVLKLLLTSSTNGAFPQSEEYEPIDSKLHSRAKDLMRKEEDLLEEIAALKREVPLQAAANWREALKSGMETDEEAMRTASRADDALDVRLDVKPLERQEDVEKTWRRGVEGLERLKKEMPGKTAKMERAKRAADYTLAEEKSKSGAR